MRNIGMRNIGMRTDILAFSANRLKVGSVLDSKTLTKEV